MSKCPWLTFCKRYREEGFEGKLTAIAPGLLHGSLGHTKFSRRPPFWFYNDLHIVPQRDEETHKPLDRIATKLTGQHR